MANCKISILAYFPIKNFVDNTLQNASSSAQFQSLVDILSATGFDFDTKTKEDRETLNDIFNDMTSNNPAFNTFKKWVTEESYVVKEKTEKPKTGGQSVSPQNSVVEQSQIDQSLTGVKKSQLDFNKTSPKRKDVAINFFGGDFYSFKKYEERTKKEMFKSVLVNFDEGYSVKNNTELTRNLNFLYKSLFNDLKDYLIAEGIVNNSDLEDTVLEKASDHFKQLLNASSISSLEGSNPKAFKAYGSFVSLKVGFDNIAAIYSLGIVKIKSNLVGKYDTTDVEKYYLDNGANFAFSYGNDNFSLLDETTSLLKALVDITNVVKIDDNGSPYVDESEYLNMNSVLATITKIKTAHSVKDKYTRFGPVMGYSKIMQDILSNPRLFPEFTNDDKDNLRTMYNFYYKGANDHPFNIPSIHSLTTIYADDVKQLGVNDTDTNLLTNISSHFDKAVSKLYTSMEYNESTKTWVSKEAKESNANKQYNQNIDVLNNYIASNYKTISKSNLSKLNVLSGSGDVLTSPTVNFSEIIFEVSSQQISLPTSFGKNDFISGFNGELTDPQKLKIYNAIVDADAILKLNLFTNSARLGKYLFDTAGDLNVKGMLRLASNVLYLSDAKNRAEKLMESKKVSYKTAIKEVMTKTMYDRHVPNDRSINAIAEDDGGITSFLLNLATAQNFISGDAYKSTITADSGAKFPSVGLISVIHDDKTNFAEIEMAISEALPQLDGMDSPEMQLDLMKSFETYNEILVPEYVAATGDTNPTEYAVDQWFIEKERSKFENDLKKAINNLPVTKNLFGQYDTAEGSLTNFDLLDGEILRTTISIDGEVKEAAKMSTGELATHAIFGDFYGNIANSETGNNTVAMQLVVYADKIGQMLKKFNLNHVVDYNGNQIDLKRASMDQLKDLHRSTIGKQYLALQTRVSDELRTLFTSKFDNHTDALASFELEILDKFKRQNPWMLQGLDSEMNILPDYISKTATKQVNDLKKALKSAKKIVKGENLLYTDYEQILPLYSEEELVNQGVNAGIDVQHEVHYAGRGKLALNNVLVIEFANYADNDEGIEKQNKRMTREQKKMARSLLKNGFSMSVFDESGVLRRVDKKNSSELERNPQLIAIEKYIKGIDPSFSLDDWTNNETGELVVFKKDGKNGKLEDLKIDYSKKYDPIRSDIDFKMNPIFEYYFWMHNILTTNYNLAVAGGIHGHELKRINRMDVKGMSKEYNDGLFEEAVISARTTASDKRNVFYQATRHEYEQDVVEGIPLHVRTAVINDTKGFLYNLIGETENFANMDGSALMTAKAMIMGDNSLGQVSTRSFTHKLIHHRYDPRYLVAELEKYAVFGITNEMIRKSVGSKIKAKEVLQKMEDIRLGNTFDIFNPEYNGDSLVDIGDGFVMWDYLMDKALFRDSHGKIHRVLGFKRVDNPDGSVSYLRKTEILNNDGTVTENIDAAPIRMDSVYSLWEALGGENSVEEFPDGNFKLGPHGNFYYSEASNYNSAEVMNRYRKLKDPKKTEYIQSNYDMPLKEAMIYQLNNTSGIKNGAKNINPASRWSDNQVDRPFHSYITNTLHWGIQMNSDHGYDEEHAATVTEMSQVISAAEANGNYHNVAKQLYKNIAKVVELSMEKYNKALSDALGGNRSEVYMILTKDMMKSLLNADELGFAQSYLARVKNSLDELGKTDDTINVNDLYNTILTSFSDNNMYSAMISMIAGSVNRNSIKRKYSGIAAVIRPGRDLYTVKELDGRVLDNEQLSELEYTQTTPNRITPYDTVRITSNGKSVNFNFENPQIGYKTAYDAYFDFKENPSKFLKNLGLEESDNVSYETVSGNPRNLRGTVLQINYNGTVLDRLDLDSVRAKFALNQLKDVYGDYQKAADKVDEMGAENLPESDHSKLSFSIKDLENAQLDLAKKQKAYDDFTKSKAYVILKTFQPRPDEEIISDFKNASLQLFKEVEKDHLLLEKGQLRIPSSLNNGKVSLEESSPIAPVVKKNAECLLSNINRFKYGIEKGKKLSEIDFNYFYNKLVNKQLTRFKHSDFYTESLKTDDQLHFLNRADYEIFRDSNPGKVKASAKVQTEVVTSEDGSVTTYVIDSSTGNRLFPLNGFTDANNVNDLDNLTNKVVEIDGQLVIVYDNVESINNLVSDANFSGGVFKYNYNGNLDQQRLYHSQYDNEDRNVGEILNINNKKDRQNLAVKKAVDQNKLLATQLNESWKKQLQVIAARIPAQSLQSFMTMEVVGFIDDDINAVILPTMKNWLDGSDFDIDKTYMLGFGVDKKGLLFKFNNQFNETEAETSYLKLPIPEGKKVSIQYVNDSTITPEQITNSITYLNSSPIDQRTKFLDFGVSNLFEDYADVLSNDYYSGDETVYIKLPASAASIPGIEKLIKAFENYHKRQPKGDVILETTKNSVAQSLMTISSAIGNVLSGERPISMDGTREASGKTTKAQDARELSREDPMSIYQQIIQQNAGKAVVGISAVGEKVFFAYSYHINESLSKIENSIKDLDDADPMKLIEAKNQLRRLSGNTTIKRKDGKIIIPNLIANANLVNTPFMNYAYDQFLNDLNNEATEEYGEGNFQIINVKTIDDASLVISEVLSAATDNAKELILDKINAGPELAGVYMYMIMQGVPFGDIADIMISDTVNKVVAKSKQNWFNTSQKNNNIDNAISYFEDGVNPYDFFPEHSLVAEFAKRLQKSTGVKWIKKGDDKESPKMYINKVMNSLSKKKLENLKKNINTDSFNTSVTDRETGDIISRGDSYYLKFMINKFINENINREQEMGPDQAKFIAELTNFKKLREESDELTIFGRRLGINQGIKTTMYDSYNYDYSMNNWLHKQFKRLPEGAIDAAMAKLGPSLDRSVLTNIKEIHSLHEGDQKVISDLYNEVKYSMNILEAELNLPHFASMIKAGYTTQDIFDTVSSRYDIHNQLVKGLTEKGYMKKNSDGYNYKFDDKEFKTISSYVVNKLIDKFFAENKQFKFKIPSGSKMIGMDSGKYAKITADNNYEFDLSTPENKATFKLFFESEFIPKLQEAYPDNKFIQSLIVDKKRNPINGTEYFYTKSNFNMSSVTDKKNVNSTAEIIFNGIQEGFENLNSAVEFGNNVQEMFAIYNILINKNAFGASTFTKLFQSTSYINDVNAPFNKFMEYQGKRDLFKDLLITDQMYDEVALRLAEVVTYAKQSETNSRYLKRFNKKKGRYDVIKYDGTEPSVVTLQNVDADVDSFMIDDFISDAIIDKLAAAPSDIKLITSKLNSGIRNGSIIQFIKCD